MIRDRRGLLISLAWTVVMSAGLWVRGEMSFAELTDCVDSLIPGKQFLSLMKDYSGWVPWAGGTDVWAHSLIVPLDWPLFHWLKLPVIPVVGLIFFLQRWLACWGTYLLVSRLGASFVPAMAAGGIYSIFYPVHFAHIRFLGFTLFDGLFLPALPLILFWLGDPPRHRLEQAGRLAAVFLLASSSVFLYGLYLLPFWFAWFLWIEPRREKTVWVTLATYLGVVLAAWALPFLASLRGYPFSHRNGWSGSEAMPALGAQLEIVGRFLWLAWPAVLCAALVPLFFWKRTGRGQKNFFILFGSLLALYAFQPYAEWLAFRIAPMLARTGISRLLNPLPFFLAVATGIGLKMVDEHRSERRWPLLAGIAVLALIWPVYRAAISQRQFFIRSVAGENYRDYLHPESFSELKEKMASDTTLPRAGTWPGYPATLWYHGLPTVDGYLNLYSGRYHEFWMAVIEPVRKESYWIDYVFRSWGNRISLFKSPNPNAVFEQSYNLPLLSLAGLRYLVAWDTPHTATLRPTTFGLAARQVWENPQAFPRYFLTFQTKRFASGKEVLESMAVAGVEELRTKAYLRTGDPGVPAAWPERGEGQGSVTLESYTNSEFRLRVEVTGGPAVLVVTENWTPGWSAEIEGQPATPFPADHTFQGLVIPEGRHRVRLWHTSFK